MTTIDLNDGQIQLDLSKLSLYEAGFWKNFKPSRKVFNKFIVFNEHYMSLDAKARKIYDDLGTLRGAKLKTAQQNIKTWYDSLVSDITHPNEILEFVNLASVCGNETMYSLAVWVLADDLEAAASADAIRERYQLQNDFTEAETIQLEKEDEIWNKINES